MTDKILFVSRLSMHGLLTMMLIVAPYIAHANDATRQLLDAARKGVVSEIVWALEQGADVNAIDSGGPVGWSPLLFAVNRNNLEAVVVLLKRGADPNLSSNSEPPVYVTTGRNTRILKALLEHSADPNVTNILNDTPLGGAARCKPENFLSLKKRGGYVGELPDCDANVELLLGAGAKVNAPGWRGDPPITVAVESNNPEIVKRLVRAGANINMKNKDAQTPLAAAFYSYAIEQHARQVKWQHSGAPMLPMIELLLRLGADPNHRDKKPFNTDHDARIVPYMEGYTLLGFTARNGWYRATELLLKHGADPRAARTDGTLPVDIADQHGHLRTANLIRMHMIPKPANRALQATGEKPPAPERKR